MIFHTKRLNKGPILYSLYEKPYKISPCNAATSGFVRFFMQNRPFRLGSCILCMKKHIKSAGCRHAPFIVRCVMVFIASPSLRLDFGFNIAASPRQILDLHQVRLPSFIEHGSASLLLYSMAFRSTNEMPVSRKTGTSSPSPALISCSTILSPHRGSSWEMAIVIWPFWIASSISGFKPKVRA